MSDTSVETGAYNFYEQGLHLVAGLPDVAFDFARGVINFHTSPMGLALSALGLGVFTVKSVLEGRADLKRHFQNSADFHDPRERKARALFWRGSATVDEVLEAAYGEWPVKGLNITERNDQRVRFADMFGSLSVNKNLSPFQNIAERFQYYSQWGGNAALLGERRISANVWSSILKPSLVGKSGMVRVLGHEAAHILQGDHYYRAAELFGEDNLQDVKLHGDLRSRYIAAKVFFKHGASIDHFPEPERQMLKYYGDGAEIQARLHELMAEGYQHWRELPSDPHHAVIALKNMGADVPDDVIKKLRELPDFGEVNHKFSPPPTINASPMPQINILKESLTPTGWSAFWHKTIPDLYSDLAGLYGDRSFAIPELNMAPYPPRQTTASRQPAFSNLFINSAQDISTMAKDLGGPLAISKDAIKQLKNAHVGMVSEIAIGAGAGILALASGHSFKESAQISVEIAVPYADAGFKAAQGDQKGAIRSAMTETAGIGGAVAGAAAGATLGGTLGTVVPGLGNLAGGVIGGIAGGIAGGFGFSVSANAILEKNPYIIDVVDRAAGPIAAFSKKAMGAIEYAVTSVVGAVSAFRPPARDADIKGPQRTFDIP